MPNRSKNHKVLKYPEIDLLKFGDNSWILRDNTMDDNDEKHY